MIRAVIVMNDQGKPRLVKFYDYQPVEKQQDLIRRLYGALCSRPENVSNFVQADSIFGPDSRLVYKTYATLYFVFLFDASENELAILDLMQGSPQYVAPFTRVFLLVTLTRKRAFAAFPKLVDVVANVFVETLDKSFSNVCELDIVFNFNKVHTILDELILGGQVLETNSSEIVNAVEEISRLERASNAVMRMPKSIPGWQGR